MSTTAGLISAFSMIVVSEIGDKTFLIAAIMSMTFSKMMVFTGAISALSVMTILSTAFGVLFPRLFSKGLTTWAAAILFAVFGFKMVRDGWKMSESQLEDEYSQVQHELEEQQQEPGAICGKPDSKASEGPLIKSPLFWKVASLTFLAEWGDRSQIATIALAAAQDPLAVTIGAIAGHALCTLAAVIFGNLLARWLSIRTVTIAGGSLFVVFSVLTVLGVM
jgi:putative Ca2+/H+ antiporter (TMEM165/GDT1 family)